MAKDYTNAIKKLEEMRKEREGKTTPPSSVLSGEAKSSTKDYSAAIERMRENQAKRKEAERPYAQLDTLRDRFENNPSRLPTAVEKTSVSFVDGTTKKLDKNIVADSLIGRESGDPYWIPGTPISSVKELQREIDRINNVDKPAAGEKYENALKYYDRDSEEVKNAYEEFEGMDGKIQELEEKIKLREEYDKYAEYQKIYAPLVNNADFKEKSKFDATYEANDYPWFTSLYKAINGDEEEAELIKSLSESINPYGWLERFDLKEFEMNNDEVALFNYIAKTQGHIAAEEYVKFIGDSLSKKQRERIESETKAYAEKHPVWSSVKTVLNSPDKALAYIGQGFDLLESGEINPNALYNKPVYSSKATRDKVSEIIENNWGSAGSFAYDIGMSMGDFLMASAVTGGSGLATVVLGSGAAAETTLDAIERGVPSQDAFILGTAAGVIEAATEKLSIDELFKIPTKNELVKYIVKNTLSEAGEEAISEVANTLADAIISGDRAELVLRVNELRAAGLSEHDAITKVLLQKLGETGLAALGGGISGFAMSGGNVAVNLGTNAVKTGIDKVADANTKLKAQEAIRSANASDTVAKEKADQKKYTVLPTLLEIERAKARENGEVFDIGYEKPYTGVADTDEDIYLQKRIDEAKTITEKTGIRHGASSQQIADALELSRALGREIEFFTQESADGKTVKDGFYSTENGHIYVNVNAAKSLETVISHELTHSLEGTTLYNELESLVREYMKRKGRDFEGAMADARKVYEKAGVDYAGNDAQIKNEVIANFVEKNILGDKKTILEITKNKPSLARRIRMFLANLISKLSKNRAGNAYAVAQDIKDMYDTAMSAAEEAPTADGVVENATDNVTAKDNAVENKPTTDEGEVVEDEETPVKKEKLVTEASHDSERAEEKPTVKEKAPAKTETKNTKAENADTSTTYLEEAEEFMRQAEEDFDEGRITEEEFEARERYYEELYASGGNIEKSSEGFSTEGGAPKFVRKIGEKLGFSVSEIDKDDIQKEYEKNVDAVLNGTYNSSDPLIIGRTPEALERIGLAALPVTITSNHVYSIAKTEAEAKADNQYNKGVNYHGLGADVVKNIMSEISNPIMVVISPDSAKSNNRQRNSAHRIIVIVELSLDNKKVIAPIEIDAEVSINQTQIDSNHVVSYYDKNNVKSLVEETFAQENIGKTAIYYGNKKRIEDFVKPLGLQLPARFKNITDSNTIIRNVNNNVNRKIENVTQSQQFKRWFGDWQNDPKSASKVVNADGTPKVMYHGTRSENGEFWEFNYNKSKKKGGMGFKTFGQGNYFTSQRLDGSERYGPRVIEAYLNIKNPFELTMGDGLDFRQKVSKSLNINTAQMTYSAIQKVMKDAGYDGVILYEQNGEIAIAVTFDSTQIKSATDNIGTFDTSNPDIRYSVSENDTESPTTDAYSELDAKAKRHLNGIEKTIGRAFAQTLNLDIRDDNGREDAAKLKKVIEEAVRPITNEYLTTGDISQSTINEVFENHYKSPNGLPASLYDREKMDALGMLEKIIDENWNMLRNVRMYQEEKNREKANNKVVEPIEREEVRRRFETLREMQKLERRAMRENLLTDSDMLVVGKLLRGETSLANVNSVKHNVEGIRAVYEAKMQTKEAEAAVSEYQRQRKAKLYEKADKYLENTLSWKDKNTGLQYQRETLERNIMDMVPDRALAREIIREYVSPVHQHEADSIRWKTKLADRVRALDLSLKKSKDGTVSEAYAVQFWGEANDNIKLLEASNKPNAKRDGHTLEEWQAMIDNMWDSNPNIDQEKIKKAAEEFRKIYEEIFEEMNNVLLDNGYAPVPYRKGYFPHFTGEEETVLAKFGRLLGIRTEMVALPTTINGLTETFKPGRTWFGHGQQRKGFYTTYDAVKGFEQYIKGAADVIFHTEDIQNLRALATRIRYNASDETIKRKIKEYEADEKLDDAERETLIQKLREEGKYNLSKFVVYLDEYTNKLANKKSKLDRGIESLFGRGFYVAMNNLESRVAANMIVGNLGSALTNFIPVNQAAAVLGWDWMLKGMKSAYENVLNGDSINEASTFLMNRRGYESLIQTKVDKVSNILGKPMEIIDNLASEMIVRAAYAKNLAAGLTANEALYQADLFAASVMADRSKGAMPLIFENKNPLIKLVTQFQLEVNNEFSVLFKDIPRTERKRWQDHIAYVLFKYFLGAFIYNELYELIVGRRAALDPIGIGKEVYKDVRDGKSAGETIKNAGTSAVESLPFVGGVIGGGRVPIQSALPNLVKLYDSATNTEWSAKKRWATFLREIVKPAAYLVPPAGGGTIKKLAEGIELIARGGRYTVDNEGNKILQYPFYGDQGFMTAVEGARAIAFGTTSTEPGQEWVENGFDSLGVKQTAVYESLIESGVGEKEAYDLINTLADVEPEVKETIERTYTYAGITVKIDEPLENDVNVLSKSELQRQVIRDSELDGEGRAIMYFGLMASETEQRLLVKLDELGADMGEAADVLMGFKDAENTAEKLDLLIGAKLEDDEKRFIYEDRISESRVEDIYAFKEAGMNFDTFLECNKKYNELYNLKDVSASYKATQLARWINQKGFSEDKKAVIEEAFKYYSMMPAKAQSYDKYVEAGLDDETAYKLVTAISDLEPLEGSTRVSNLQKYRAVIDTVGSPVYQMDALETVMTESAFKKTSVAYSYGIEAETYVSYLETLEGFDKDGSGSLTQFEVEEALRSLSGNLTWKEKMTIELTGGKAPGLLYVSDDQLAVLWQLSGNWNPKNNPYSPEIGAKVKALLDKE